LILTNKPIKYFILIWMEYLQRFDMGSWVLPSISLLSEHKERIFWVALARGTQPIRWRGAFRLWFGLGAVCLGKAGKEVDSQA